MERIITEEHLRQVLGHPAETTQQKIHPALTRQAIEFIRRAPILFLAGSKDALVRRSPVEDIRRIRDDVQFSTIDAPHLLLQREPAGAWREISGRPVFTGRRPR